MKESIRRSLALKTLTLRVALILVRTYIPSATGETMPSQITFFNGSVYQLFCTVF